MRRTVVVLLCVTFLMPLLPASGQGDPVTSANWLNTQQFEDGGFGDEVGATALSVIALASVGQDNQAALDWLENRDFDTINLDWTSLSLMALVASGTDVGSFADGELLATYSQQLRDADGSITDGYCLGLIARYTLNIPLSDTQITTLLDQQRADGGFAANPDAESDIITTSLCVQALVAGEQTDATQPALDYMRSLQRDDGGWTIDVDSQSSDPLATAFVMQALIAADQSFSNWENPERTLILFADADGAFLYGDGNDPFFNLISTAVSIPVFEGLSLLSFSPFLQTDDATQPVEGDAPVLNENWKLVGDGFSIDLVTADDFFTTVVDPFTDEELYGVEIINWTSEYPYTGYIVELYLTADIVLYMIEQDPSTADNISATSLALMPAEELALLPEDLQARAQEAE